MDLDTYMQSLEAALDRNFDEATKLLVTYSKQYEDATFKVLRKSFLSISHDRSMKICQEAFSPEYFENVQMKIISEMVKLTNWPFLRRVVDSSDWRKSIFKHILQHKEELNVFLKNVVRVGTGPKKQVKQFLAHAISEETFAECVCALTEMYCKEEGNYDDPGYQVYNEVYIQHLKSFNKSQLEPGYTNLLKDDRYPCQYLAVLIAVRLEKWTNVASILKKGHVILVQGSAHVFGRAMYSKEWTSAAMVMAGVLGEETGNDVSVVMDLQFVVETYFTFQCDKNKRQSAFQLFLAQCEALGLYAAGATFAAWHGRWGETIRILHKHLHPNQGERADNALLVVLGELITERKFRSVFTWLQMPCNIPLTTRYIDSILFNATQHYKEPAGKVIVKKLLPMCRDYETLTEVLYTIMSHARIELLDYFLAQGLLELVEDHSHPLSVAIDMLTTTHKEQQYVRFQVIQKFLEAGGWCSWPADKRLFNTTFFVSPNGHLQLKAAHLLYLTGILPPTGFRDLLLTAQTKDDSHKTEPNILRPNSTVAALLDEAERPHPLERLCCFAVSQMLGFGENRKCKALGLGLPSAFLPKVLLLDIIYSEDFAIDTTESLFDFDDDSD